MGKESREGPRLANLQRQGDEAELGGACGVWSEAEVQASQGRAW